MPIRFAEPCTLCGAIYLEGSKTVCSRCQRLRARGERRVDTRIRFRCDCGEMAVAVVLVQVGPEQGQSETRLPLCPACLREETLTQALLDEFGFRD